MNFFNIIFIKAVIVLYTKKTIAILTRGGDAPGMNAAVRAVARAAISNDLNVIGIRRGYSGLLTGDIFEMNLRSVSEIIHRGGTILYTARSDEFKTPQGVQKAAGMCKLLGIDGIIAIGGDGTIRGTKDLSEAGVACLAIPATIDNDVGCTEYTIGFDTAMNTAMEMVDKLRDTAQSHERCSIVEVMGRKCGDLALHTGIAVGAMCILVPEVPYSLDEIIMKMKRARILGKKHFIIVVAEGVGKIEKIAKEIYNATGIESRSTVLGHVQRGGSPTLLDRVAASEMGCHAINLFLSGEKNKVIIKKDGKITDIAIHEALEMKKLFDEELYKTVLEISV